MYAHIYILQSYTATRVAAFLRDAESYSLHQRVGALPIFDELAMLNSNVMLRFNRLVDVNYDYRLTGAMGGFPERPMPVLRSAEHVSEHRRFEDVVNFTSRKRKCRSEILLWLSYSV